MSTINITNIQVLNNPAPFQSPLKFQVSFECLKDIEETVEWKLVYIGNSKDDSYDQVLDEFQMDSLEYGIMEFELESNYPDPARICPEELLGVTAVILSVSFKGKEFFRVGYYVYNYYEDPELNENPPETVQIDRVTRNILADKPRITRFDIKWDGEEQNTNSNNMEELKENDNTGVPTNNNDALRLFMNQEGNSTEDEDKKNNNPFTESQSPSVSQQKLDAKNLFLGTKVENDISRSLHVQSNPF